MSAFLGLLRPYLRSDWNVPSIDMEDKKRVSLVVLLVLLVLLAIEMLFTVYKGTAAPSALESLPALYIFCPSSTCTLMT